MTVLILSNYSKYILSLNREIMKRLFFTIALTIGFANLGFCQFDHLMIGLYDYDYDGYFMAYPPGTDHNVGNDTAYLHMLAKQNFNYLLIAQQVMPSNFGNIPAKFVTSSPSKNFLDTAYFYGLKVILQAPELSINNHFVPTAATYNSANSLSALNYYGYHPAIAGFSITDEPGEIHFPYINSFNTDIKNFNSSLIRFTNLFPLYACDQFLTGEYRVNPNVAQTYNAQNNPDVGYAAHVQKFIDETNPNMIASDIYPLGAGPLFYYNLDILAKKSTDNKMPFIYVTTLMDEGTSLCYGCTTPIISIPKYNYLVYSALSYGAKGIYYWNPDFIYHSWIGAVPLSTMNYLIPLHKKIIDNGDPLTKLSFRSAYHYSFNTTVSHVYTDANGTHGYTTERIPNRSLWSNLKNDVYAKQVLDVNNPFVPASGSSIDNLAVTFSTDESNRVYYWLLNKNISTAIDFTVNLSGTLSLKDILNNTNISAGKSYTVHLEPGEAKIYGVTCPTNYDLTESLPHTVNKIDLAEHAITSTAQINSGVSVEYVAGKTILLNPGFKSQSSSVFKGMIVDCNNFTSPVRLTNNDVQINNYSSEDATNSEVSVYPNPSNGSFRINLNFTDPTSIDIAISNSIGEEICNYSLGTITNHTKEFNFEKEPSGFYYIKITSSDRSINRKIILSR